MSNSSFTDARKSCRRRSSVVVINEKTVSISSLDDHGGVRKMLARDVGSSWITSVSQYLRLDWGASYPPLQAIILRNPAPFPVRCICVAAPSSACLSKHQRYKQSASVPTVDKKQHCSLAKVEIDVKRPRTDGIVPGSQRQSGLQFTAPVLLGIPARVPKKVELRSSSAYSTPVSAYRCWMRISDERS